MGWLAVPRDWLASFGDIARFCARVLGIVYSGRVLHFFGVGRSPLRPQQIGALDPTLQPEDEDEPPDHDGRAENQDPGLAQRLAGVFSAWCDLREVAPYAFGYMLSAKVGTGIVAELGAMRISDRPRALGRQDGHAGLLGSESEGADRRLT